MDLDRSAELYNEIGVAAVEQIGTVDTKILIYAENEDDVIRVLVRYSAADAEVVDSLSETAPVVDAIEDLVSFLEEAGEEHVWRSIEYVVDYGKVDVQVSYDKSFEEGLALWEKGAKLLEKHFAGKPHS